MPVSRSKQKCSTSTSESSSGAFSVSPSSKTSFAETNGDTVDENLFTSSFDDIRACCNPLGCSLGDIDSSDPGSDAVKFICSNESCPCSSFMHGECFTGLEESLITILKQSSRTKNWNDKQRKQAIWRKGCECRCKRGNLKKDPSYVPALPEGDSEKKKRKKKSHDKAGVPTVKAASYPRQNGFVLRRRCRNSDSQSSDSGVPTCNPQPFLHRSPNDYDIFSKYLPKALTNSYHIKMEDDGYGAGDDTRSFVLTTLASNRINSLSCVLCSMEMKVYDRYPLVNGTLFLTPNQANETCVEVESKGNHPLYLSAVCLLCLSGHNKVTCTYCSADWQGNIHQIGTMYSYDLFAATPCCTRRVTCTQCSQPVVDVQKHSLSFWQLSQQVECSHCSTSGFHLIKPLSTFHVSIGPSKD